MNSKLLHKMHKLAKLNAHMILNSVRHPGRPLVYHGNPSTVIMSPIPWLLSTGCIIMGVAIWCLAVHLGISQMEEVARILAYGGVGNIFGINVGLKTAQVSKGIKDC